MPASKTRKLRLQETGAGRQNFKVCCAGIAECEKFLRVFHRLLKLVYLLKYVLAFLSVLVKFHKRVAHFSGGVENGILKIV